jgi:hypothetical protein
MKVLRTALLPFVICVLLSGLSIYINWILLDKGVGFSLEPMLNSNKLFTTYGFIALTGLFLPFLIFPLGARYTWCKLDSQTQARQTTPLTMLFFIFFPALVLIIYLVSISE